MYTACNKGYQNISNHRCSQKCGACLSQPECEEAPDEARIAGHKCEECLRLIFSDDCFNCHEISHSYSFVKSVWEVLRICDVCSRLLDLSKDKNHKYVFSSCRTCRCTHEYSHDCYIKFISYDSGVNKANEPVIFIFYDLKPNRTKRSRGTMPLKNM